MMLAVGLWTAAWAVLGAPDGDEEACALNGEVQHGRCVCDEGWKGDRCQLLNLSPPDADQPHGYFNASMPTWGGDAILSNGTWHLFVTAKADIYSPYDNYMCNAAIVRLTGPSRSGPFKYAETVLPNWHHEAHAMAIPPDSVGHGVPQHLGKGGAGAEAASVAAARVLLFSLSFERIVLWGWSIV